MKLDYLLLRLEVSKLLHEGVLGGEPRGLQEVQQAEQFLHRVLQGSPGQQDYMLLHRNTGHRVSTQTLVTTAPESLYVHIFQPNEFSYR